MRISGTYRVYNNMNVIMYSVRSYIKLQYLKKKGILID